MPKPIIAIDLDDVLAQGTESLRIVVNKQLGINLTREDYKVPKDTYSGYYEHIWQDHGIADRVDFDVLNQGMEIDQSHITPFEESRKALAVLSEVYDFVIITARRASWKAATEAWVNTNYPGLFQKIYFAGQKDDKSKGEVCVELGAEWLIDDNLHHAHTAIEMGIKVILFGDYGWQMNQEIHKDVLRCKTWYEVQRVFNEDF